MRLSIRSLLALAAFTLTAFVASAADFAIVANASAPDSLSKDDVKNILLGNRTKWDSGGNIRLAVLGSGATHEAVIQAFTARSTDQFDKYWKKLVFTGKGTAPDVFKTEEDLIAFVAKNPGAIGYVTAGANAAGVKVLKVN